MNWLIQSNMETINLYKNLIKGSKWTIRETQCWFYRFEIKKLILENYELAQIDIENERIRNIKPKEVVRQPSEVINWIWDLNSKKIFKFRNKDEVDMEKLEELSLDYIK